MEQNRGGHVQGRRGNQAGHDAQGGAEQLYDQARNAMSDVADRASEMWDDAYDQGARYYREGSRAVANIDGSAIAFALVAGLAGYALAYVIHGQQSYSRADEARNYRTRHGNNREQGRRNR